ncbi:putative Rha family regulatory protein [Vibrio phage 199E37-1]|nr:putative Rha family regulatory protein [Vibrio phage 199E37-1]
MNQLITSNQPLTMTSTQLAQMLGFESKSSINKAIRKMFDDSKLESFAPSLDSRGYVIDYNLPELESKMFVAKHNIEYLEMITKYWIDKGNENKPALPNNKQLALMVIQAEEEKEQALLLVEQKSQHIEGLESLFHSGGTIAQFVKQLNGVNSQRVNAWLNENTKWLYDENKGKVYTQGPKQGQSKPYVWRCASYARDKYLTETNYNLDRQGMESMVKYEFQLLADGKKWLFDKYTKGLLPMKANWNGDFTHKKDLV